MITKKEDLVNTYIVNDNGILRSAYINACKPFIEVHEFEQNLYPEDEYLFFCPSYGHLQTGICDSKYFKQLHLSDLISLENSKIYTTDKEVIRKYAELCGEGITERSHGDYIGYSFSRDARNTPTKLFPFKIGSDVHVKNKTISGTDIHEITTVQINALYVEKFGDGNNGKQLHELPEFVVPEWKNGDECIWNGEKYYFIGMVPNGLRGFWGNCMIAKENHTAFPMINNLSKPETAAQKLERERLEAAYDLYAYAMGDIACERDTFMIPSSVRDIWLKVVDKTNYRKESK